MNKVIISMLVVIVVLSGIIFGASVFHKQEYASQNVVVPEQTDYTEVAEIYDDCTDEVFDSYELSDVMEVNSDYGSDTNKSTFILRDKVLGGVEVQPLADHQPLDGGDVGVGGHLLGEADLLDQPVQPQADRGVGHPVLGGHLFQGAGGQDKLLDKHRVLLLQLRHPGRHGLYGHRDTSLFCVDLIINFNFIKVNT